VTEEDSMTFFNLFLGLYVIPAIAIYLFLRWNYTIYEPHEEPVHSDIAIILIPLVNLFWAVIALIFFVRFYLGLDSKSKEKINMRKFFKL
jgi:hypothetical protein